MIYRECLCPFFGSKFFGMVHGGGGGSTGRSGRQKEATRSNMWREERVTVQGLVGGERGGGAKWFYGTIGFVGAGDFVLGIQQGQIFCLSLCVYSKYSEFGGEFKNG